MTFLLLLHRTVMKKMLEWAVFQRYFVELSTHTYLFANEDWFSYLTRVERQFNGFSLEKSGFGMYLQGSRL